MKAPPRVPLTASSSKLLYLTARASDVKLYHKMQGPPTLILLPLFQVLLILLLLLLRSASLLAMPRPRSLPRLHIAPSLLILPFLAPFASFFSCMLPPLILPWSLVLQGWLCDVDGTSSASVRLPPSSLLLLTLGCSRWRLQDVSCLLPQHSLPR